MEKMVDIKEVVINNSIIRVKEGYKISNLGFLYKNNKRLSDNTKGSGGYIVNSIMTELGQKKVPRHRIVAYYFCDGYSEGLLVNHIDEDKLNNNSVNLEWSTPSENTTHSIHKRKGINSTSSKEINHYATKGTTRTDFKRIATRQGWEISDFKEVHTLEWNGTKPLYYYIYDKENAPHSPLKRLSKSIDRYSSIPYEDSNFNSACIKYGWDYNDFKAIPSNETNGGRVLYYYVCEKNNLKLWCSSKI